MDTYYLGIDVSKGYADFMILDKDKQCVEDSFQLDDTFSGHCLLYERLVEFFDKHPGCLIYAAVESTGGYENNWFNLNFPQKSGHGQAQSFTLCFSYSEGQRYPSVECLLCRL